MRNENPREVKDVPSQDRDRQLQDSLPTTGYRRRSWREFQRALDPLAPPKPLRPPRS